MNLSMMTIVIVRLVVRGSIDWDNEKGNGEGYEEDCE